MRVIECFSQVKCLAAPENLSVSPRRSFFLKRPNRRRRRRGKNGAGIRTVWQVEPEWPLRLQQEELELETEPGSSLLFPALHTHANSEDSLASAPGLWLFTCRVWSMAEGRGSSPEPVVELRPVVFAPAERRSESRPGRANIHRAAKSSALRGEKSN